MKITLETERLILRAFELDDAYDMYNNWASDEDVTKYLTWNHHTSIDDTISILKLWIEQYEKPERINFAIVLKETNQLIGGIDVCGYIDNIPVIGYVLSKKYWNKGYMTEACQKVINFLFEKGYNKIKIDAAVDNIGSNKVIKKCGGIFIDTIEEYIKAKDTYIKINRYEIKK